MIADAGDPGPYGELDASPDESLIAITRQEPGAPGSEIWVIDWQRRVNTKVTLDPADDMNPVWAPDGKRIAFVTYRKGNADIFVKNANGIGPETPLLETPADEFVEDWSKDGRYLAYKQVQGEYEDLYVLPFDADGKPGKPFPIIQGPYHKDEPQFSYDGQWLAYVSDESGRFEVYVTSFPALDQKLKVTDAGGGRPRWRRDSKEIFYHRAAVAGVRRGLHAGPEDQRRHSTPVVFAQCPRRRGANGSPVGRLGRWPAVLRQNRREHCGWQHGCAGGIPTFPPNLVAAGQASAASGATRRPTLPRRRITA